MLGTLFRTIIFQPMFNILILLAVLVPGHSIGWAIILLTVLIRVLLIPSAAQSIKQQHKLKQLQPELKAIQEKYKDDRETQAKELVELYKRYGIHPAGSCLPLLIQLPIIIPLYYVFKGGLDTSHFNLLYSFVPHPSSINTFFFGINLAIPNRTILPYLAGILQFVQSWMLLKDPRFAQSTDPDNQTQKVLNSQLLYFMPAVTIFISLSLPAALPLYWVVTTLFAILQQQVIFQNLAQPDRVPAVSGGSAMVPTQAPIQPSLPNNRVQIVVRKKGSS